MTVVALLVIPIVVVVVIVVVITKMIISRKKRRSKEIEVQYNRKLCRDFIWIKETCPCKRI